MFSIQLDYLGLQMPPKIASIEENSRASFPLGASHSSYYVKPRLALIGYQSIFFIIIMKIIFIKLI